MQAWWIFNGVDALRRSESCGESFCGTLQFCLGKVYARPFMFAKIFFGFLHKHQGSFRSWIFSLQPDLQFVHSNQHCQQNPKSRDFPFSRWSGQLARFKYLKTRMKSKIKSLPMVSGIMGAGLASVLCSSILTLSFLSPFSQSPISVHSQPQISVSDLLFNFHLQPSTFSSTWFSPFPPGLHFNTTLCSLVPVSSSKVGSLKGFGTASQPGELGHTNICIALEFFLVKSSSLDVLTRGQCRWEQVRQGAGAIVDWPPPGQWQWPPTSNRLLGLNFEPTHSSYFNFLLVKTSWGFIFSNIANSCFSFKPWDVCI